MSGHGRPLRYDPGHWGMVFPLGMYTVAPLKLAGLIGTPFPLIVVRRIFLWLALAAWMVVFVGLVRTIGRAIRSES